MVTTDRDAAETKALDHLRERLLTRLALPADEVDAAIDASLARFADRPIRDFVPILVEREVRDALQQRSP